MHKKETRKLGEGLFAGFLFIVSLFLLWHAWTISGFETLSSPGAFPMAATLSMVLSAAAILLNLRKTQGGDALRWRDILPPRVVAVTGMIVLYAVLMVPLGFLLATFLFLTAAIWHLSSDRLWRAALISVCVLAVIYVVFRIVFSVLMPAGIVPEAEILSALKSLFNGGTGQ